MKVTAPRPDKLCSLRFCKVNHRPPLTRFFSLPAPFFLFAPLPSPRKRHRKSRFTVHQFPDLYFLAFFSPFCFLLHMDHPFPCLARRSSPRFFLSRFPLILGLVTRSYRAATSFLLFALLFSPVQPPLFQTSPSFR